MSDQVQNPGPVTPIELDPNAPPGAAQPQIGPRREPLPHTRQVELPNLDPNAPPGTMNVTGLLPQQRDILSEYIADSQDPTSEMTKQTAVDYLAALTGRDKGELYTNFNTVIREYTGVELDAPRALEAVKQWWDNAWLVHEANGLKGELFQAMQTGQDASGIALQIQQLEDRMAGQDVLSRNPFFNSFVKPAVENLPLMIDPMLEGGITGIGTALAVGGAYALAPATGGATALLVPVLTAGLMGTAAGAAGSAVRSSEIMRNESIWELYQIEDQAGNRIDPRLATTVASVVGGINGLIESIQLTQLIPGGQQVFRGVVDRLSEKMFFNRIAKNQAVRALVRYGTNVTDEAVEELQQEVVSMVARNLTTELSNTVRGTEFDRLQFEEASRRALSAFSEGFRASALLALPSNVVQTAGDFARSGRGETTQRAELQMPDAVETGQTLSEPTPMRNIDEVEADYAQALADFESNPQANVQRLFDLAVEAEQAEAMTVDATPEATPAWQMTRRQWEQTLQAAQTEEPLQVASPQVRQQIQEAMPNLTEQEIDGAAVLLDIRAEALGITTDEFVTQTFQEGQIFSEQGQLPTGQTMPQDVRGAVTFAEDGRAMITATETSDFSTWTHEMAHIFQRQLDAQQSQIAEQWAGVQDGQWSVEQEEQFATAFEEYLREGVAPTPELETIFQRFASWLKRVYGAIAPRVNVTDDIRTVFDSLVSDSQSPLAVAQGQETDTRFQPGQEDQHRKEVQDAVDRGEWVPDEVLQEYDEEQWVKDRIAEYARLREEAIQAYKRDEGLEEWVQMELAVDRDGKPELYKKLYETALSKGLPTTQDQAMEWVQTLTPELAQATLQSIKSIGAFDELPNAVKPIVSGMTPDTQLTPEQFETVRQAFMENPVQWHDTIQELTMDDDVLRRMEEAALPDTDEQAVQTLEEEVQDLLDSNIDLNRDVEALTDQITQDKDRLVQLEQEIEAFGEALTSARREAKLALQNERKRIRQSISNKQKVRTYTKRLIKAIMKRPGSTINYAQAVQISQIQEGLDPRSFRRGRAGEIRKAIQARLPDIQEAELRQAVEQELGKVSLRDMSLDSLEGIHAEIKALKAQGREELQAKLVERKAQDARDVEALLADLGGEVALSNLGTEEANRKLTSNVFQKLNFSLYNMKRLTDQIGPQWKELFDAEVNRLTDEKLNFKYDKVERYNALMKENGITSRDLMEDVTVGLTVNEAIAIHVYKQNEDSAIALENGNRLTPDVMESARQFMELNPQYKEFADGLMGLFDDESFDRLNQVFIDYNNAAMTRVDKYFPMRRQQIGNVPFDEELSQDLTSRTAAGKTYAWRGFTHSRQHVRRYGQAPLRLDAVNVALENIEKQEHFAAFGMHTKRLQRLLNTQSVRETFIAKYGRQGFDAMQEYVNRVANPSVHKAIHTGDKFLQTMRSNMTVGALAFNLTSPIKNLVGPLLYLPHISNNPVKAMAHLFSSMVTSVFDKSIRDFVHTEDPQTRERALDPVLREASELNKDGHRKVMNLIQKYGMKPLEWVDQWTVIAGEHAVYSAAKAEGLSHTEAVARMQEATLRTQPFAQPKDQPSIYNSPGMRMFLMFSSPLSQIFGMVTRDFPAYVKNGKAGVASLTMISLIMTGVMLRSIQRKRLPESPEEWVKDVSSQFIEMLPIIGPEIMGLVDQSPFAGRGVSLTESLVTGYRAVEATLDDEKSSEEKWNALVRGASDGMRVLGLPGVAARRAYRTFINDTEGIDPWELVGGGPEERED